ncbi:MAG: class I SAM-dependent methyltransferase [Armatimonadota bacterium]
MKQINGVGLRDVQAIYSGAVGDLWELVMGQQIHIGGFKSSMDLAEKAGIGAGQKGIDLCCCNGAGMRFLVRFRDTAHMTGVDATPHVVSRGIARCEAEGLADKVSFVIADVCDTGLASDNADFIWGEDAWCYVEDKTALIAEAVRLVKPGGVIAFTDWVEGPNPMTPDESNRFLNFMKFPSLLDIAGYTELLEKNGCEILHAEDTGRFAPQVDLYLNMLDTQHTYDALSIINFDMDLMQVLATEMLFTQELAHEKKIIQGLFVARKA